MNDQPPTEPAPALFNSLDGAVHTRLGRVTQGLSPAALGGAYLDWLIHLTASPGKQQELMGKARDKFLQFSQHATQHAMGQCQPCIEPLPQDKRFAAPEWQQWPFNLIYQSFLLNQQWWHNATTGVPGVTAHHEQLATFGARQVLDMFSPSNFLPSNPEVLAETVKTGGVNLLEGAQNLVREALRVASDAPTPGTENFRPGTRPSQPPVAGPLHGWVPR